MAIDKEIIELTEKTAPTATDLTVIVDMDGTPTTKKAKIGNLPGASHKTSHEDGGPDEISVAGLSGVLADEQTPLAHAASHEDGGADEISVAGLSGTLADAQTPLAHDVSHQVSGSDEISVAGLSGVLADKQDVDKIQGHAVDETAIADDRVLVYKTAGTKFIYEAKTTPGTHKTSHEAGGGDEINIAGLLGQMGEKQDVDRIQGHAVDESGIADDHMLVYKAAEDKFVYKPKGVLPGHHVSHELGEADPINITGLPGAGGGGGGGGDFLVMQVFK